MLKRLNMIKGAVSISKAQQVKVSGGLPIVLHICANICPTASVGTLCYDEHPGCPASCDGRGGWHNH